MPLSRRVHVSPEAEDDLQQIVQFTVESWGVEAGRRYSEAIWAAIQHLADFPESGSRLTGPSSDFRRFPVHSHLIFYEFDGENVGIVRILHQRMDVAAIFGS